MRLPRRPQQVPSDSRQLGWKLKAPPLLPRPAGPSEYVQGLSYEEAATLLNVDVGNEAIMTDIFDTGAQPACTVLVGHSVYCTVLVGHACPDPRCFLCAAGAGQPGRVAWAPCQPPGAAKAAVSGGKRARAGHAVRRPRARPPAPLAAQPSPSSSASTATASCCLPPCTSRTIASTTVATGESGASSAV